MKRNLLAASALVVIVLSGCDHESRIVSLEKQVKELNEKIESEGKNRRAAAEYDIQAKCAKDARQWFNENWKQDKTTTLLTYTNHYHKASNSCMVFVEYHFTTDTRGSWVNDMSLWNIYENDKVGACSKTTTVEAFSKDFKTDAVVLGCEVGGKKVETIEQFENLISPYLNN